MSPSQRPNILLITTDQQRNDTIGLCGSRVAKTPTIDRLVSERGVLFENACVQNTVCIPSRACIQTGRYTHQHGVRYMESEIDTTPGLPPWEQTFMKCLQDAGYETGATGKIHMMPERDFDWMEIVGGKGQRWTQQTGQDIGPAPLGAQYAKWLEERNPGAYERVYEQRRKPEYKNQLGAIKNTLELPDYVETYILEKSIEFMTRDRGDQPFFLWCGFCGPHGPHDPPPEYADLYPFDEIPLPDTLEADVSDRPAHLQRGSNSARFMRDGETTIRRWMSYYYALVTLIDDYVGKLVAALEEKGLLDNTLVIYTSDHGEMLGDFAMAGKCTFYEPVLNVPLFVIPPGGAPDPIRYASPVENMAIAPTILDYAGVAAPPQMQAVSLRPAIEGDPAPLFDGILSEYTTNNQAINGKCLRTDRYKIALWDYEDGGEFYDLEEDPGERTNQWNNPDYRDIRDALMEKLVHRLAGSERPVPISGRPEPY